jgi:hypothetical protein
MKKGRKVETEGGESLSNVSLSQHGNTKIEELEEGKEDADFWHRLLLFENYGFPFNEPFALKHQLAPCLLHLSQFRVTQVHRFAQSDLEEDQCYFLDTYSELYLWLGKHSSDCLRTLATTKCEVSLPFVCLFTPSSHFFLTLPLLILLSSLSSAVLPPFSFLLFLSGIRCFGFNCPQPSTCSE